MKKNIDKINLIIYSIIGVILIAIIGYIVYSNNIEETEISEIADLEEDASSISTDESNLVSDKTERANSDIGKTIEEAEEELEISKKEQIKEVTQNEKNNDEIIEGKEEKQAKEEIEEIIENVELKFMKPVQGEIINTFAKDNLIYSKTLNEWITHYGIDIKADKTSVVQASETGTIKSIKTDPRYGLTVVISHNNGFKTVYSNLLTAEFVVEGENVAKGQTIGTIGNSSSFESSEEYHLHFEVIKDGEYVDPEIYITE